MPVERRAPGSVLAELLELHGAVGAAHAAVGAAFADGVFDDAERADIAALLRRVESEIADLRAAVDAAPQPRRT